MSLPDPEIPEADLRIAGTEADRLLLGGDSLLYRPDEDLAAANGSKRPDVVRIVREYALIFGDRFLQMALHAQHVTSSKMRNRVPRRARQGFQGQLLRPSEIGIVCARTKIQQTVRECGCQQALAFHRLWI